MKYFCTRSIIIILFFNCSLIFIKGLSQDTTVRYHPIQFAVGVDNMHLWRGYSVSSAPLVNVTANYHTRNDMFAVGLWGGAGFSGEYREFDYFVNFNYKGLNVALWDIYNFSVGLPWGDNSPYGYKQDIFNYAPKTTGHFIDLSVAYTLPIEKLPLSLYWSTILYGRDRKQVGNDTGNYRSGRNQFSNYIQLSYPVYQIKGYNFGLYLGATFAFVDPHLGNFYTSKGGFSIIGAGCTVNKSFNIKNYTIPVGLNAMWNPTNGNANIQFSIVLFSIR